METEDYLALFYPFDRLDVVKQGVESSWSVSGDRTMVALTMTFADEPMAKTMSFQREYAEPYEWVAQQFKDWAFTLTTSILYYNDYDLIDEIQEIRASERRFYQKITDIYATAVDYSLDSQITKDFFATVQNKMHYAVHGSTAAEVIMARADHTKEYMGLTSWKNAPDGKIVKADVSVAKNYLSMDEMQELNKSSPCIWTTLPSRPDGISPWPWQIGPPSWTLFCNSTMRRFCGTKERSPLPLQKPLRRASLSNTASFRIDCIRATLTDW